MPKSYICYHTDRTLATMVNRIRLLLEARNLSPTQFADAIGIARPIVSHILSGRNKPSLEVVQRILTAMPDLSMAWLLNGTGTMVAASDGAPPSLAQRSDNSFDNQKVNVTANGSSTVSSTEPAFATAGSSHASPGPTRAPKKAAVPKRFLAQNIERELQPPISSLSATPLVAGLAQAAEPVKPSHAAPPVAPMPIDEQGTASAATAILAKAEKPIRRIVIFYQDGSFADYQPE